MPGQLKNSIGTIEIPITCAVKNRPIGLMYIEYLVVKPMQNHKCNFAVSYAKHWTSAWTGTYNRKGHSQVSIWSCGVFGSENRIGFYLYTRGIVYGGDA